MEEEIELESQRILVKHKIPTDDFSAAALGCLPADGSKWKIPPASCVQWPRPCLCSLYVRERKAVTQEEVGKRRDFRENCVVSIDPATAHVSKIWSCNCACFCVNLYVGCGHVSPLVAECVTHSGSKL